MKILYSGCSYVMGAEVERSERFSKLVSDALGATEYNIAYGGRSNMLSLALTITQAQETSPDYIVFGATSLARSFGLTDLSTSSKFNNLAEWNEKSEFQNIHSNVFSFSPTQPSPHAAVNQSIPVYRNNLFAHLELACIVNTLSEFSRNSGVPVCVFPAMNIKQYPEEINGVSVQDTVLSVKNNPNWLDHNFHNMAKENNDIRRQGHPGALTHRQFSAILIERIKRDLNDK